MKLSLPFQILIGLLLGIFTGFFLGEYAGVLQPFGEIFVMLLKMSVLPYITLALIHGLGSLSPRQALKLLKYGAGFMVVIWVITIGSIYAFSIAYPARQVTEFYATSGDTVIEKIPLLELFIPSNPFFALANNLVPAIVLFSVFFGIAMMFVKEKEPLLNIMETALRALTRIIKGVIRLSPYGIFALIAATTGTTTFRQFAKLESYLIVFIGLTLFLTLWALPALVTSLTRIGYRRLFKELRTPLLLAFSTGNIFVALPYVMNALASLSEETEETPRSREARSLAQTVAPISYNLPLVGNLMAMAVILFLGYFYAIDFTPLQQVRLIVSSLVTLVGPVAAGLNSISFLIDSLGLPSDGLAIFVETSAVTRNLQGVAGAMGISAFTLLTAFAFTGQVRFRPFRLLINGIITVALLFGLVLLATWLTPTPTPQPSPFPSLQIDVPSDATLFKPGEPLPPHPPLKEGESHLDRILGTGILRVGYGAEGDMPFTYFNEHGELVGYDIALAHRLANDLGVSLQLIPIAYDRLSEEFEQDRVDIIMAGVGVFTPRLEKMLFTQPVVEVELAFLVPDYRRDAYAHLADVQKRRGLRLAALAGTSFEQVAREKFPLATIVPIQQYDDVLDKVEVDAVLSTNQQGLSWVVAHPPYAVVVPTPQIETNLYAYPMAHDAYELLHFTDYWLRLQKVNGVTERNHKKWVQGKAEPPPPRWSIIRNVLHWVD
jgi:Na+/H+-dicarboxylate symporter/ABC-type amino acid transport substrate-binding protein